ncbi:MAG: SDR family oxidoreductase [Hyphomicrobiales bacterium]|nr:SDR family oxidoreductase [Hyphomicrobiales bacterium]
MDLSSDVEGTAVDIRKIGCRAATALVDVSRPDEVKESVSTLNRALGPVDILVNNAGLTKNIAPVERITAEDWNREISVNLSGPFNLINAVVGSMGERGWGRIVNISSIAARGGLHYQAGYSASKSGLIGLTHTVTLEYARYGVTCNAVLPGVIETENVKSMPELIKHAAAKTAAARRLGQVEEVAHLVAFLVSENAGYISGAEIDIDGGSRLLCLSLGSRSEIKDRFMLKDNPPFEAIR